MSSFKADLQVYSLPKRGRLQIKENPLPQGLGVAHVGITAGIGDINKQPLSLHLAGGSKSKTRTSAAAQGLIRFFRATEMRKIII